MTITINALDEEFAASTGSNVNSGSNTSTFDYPPTATSNLTITSNPGDPSPSVFSVGDTYDLSWTGMGGGGTIEDATVIRSDPVSSGGDSGHAVVFEGFNDGELVQIVWTPGFNLEDWYFDNFNQGQSPGFYTSDVSPSQQYSYVCFAASTRIAGPAGPWPVEALTPGKLVDTLDHGPQPIVWVGAREVSGRGAMAPIEFAPGTIGNTRTLRLSPQHRVLYRSGLAELYFGRSEVLVPARAYLGLPGVTERRCHRVRYCHLLLARHEILSAEGAPCESLLLGRMALGPLSVPRDHGTREAGMLFPDILAQPGVADMAAARPVLRVREAAALLGGASAARAAPREMATL